MRIISRIILLIASLLLLSAYFYPLWHIDLQAPQYPEGLGLVIWINNIVGASPHDLDNLNRINHYIGMKEINPATVPELKIIPYIFGFFIGFGLLGVITGKRQILYIWIILLILVAVAGLADFYRWGYDYGHNLNPNAAIKVPGMSYQPPLIGSKKLLNITAVSLPAASGIAAIVAAGLGMVAVGIEFFKKPKRAPIG